LTTTDALVGPERNIRSDPSPVRASDPKSSGLFGGEVPEGGGSGAADGYRMAASRIA
jgi:hypothetical protein